MRVKAGCLVGCGMVISMVVDLSAAGPRQLRTELAAPRAGVTTAVEIDGTTPLHRAAQHNDLKIAEQLLRGGADPKVKNRYGVTALSLACANGNAAMIRLLLEAGADPNTALPEGETALMTAANTGSVTALEALIASGANVNVTESSKGHTALMWAANKGHTGAVRTLIAAGAEINARSKGNFSPMTFAVRGGHSEIVKLLLASGVSANDHIGGGAGEGRRATVDSTSLVGLAMLNGQYDIAKLLLQNGADPNAADSRGSLLHTLAWMRRPGSDLNLLPPVSVGDSLDLARVLLERGANPNVRIAWEEIPFDRDDGEAKGPPNVPAGRDYIIMTGATPYFLAAKGGDVELMRVLLANGANPKPGTAQGVTPFMAAAGLGYWDGESSGPLNGTPEAERLEAVKLALEQSGEDINGTADFGGNLEFTEDPDDLFFAYPLKYSADPTTEPRPEAALGDVRWAGSTAMHGAAVMGQFSIIQYLVEKGARLDARNQLGWTPLMMTQGMLVAANARFFPRSEALLKELMVARGMDPAQYGRTNVTTNVGQRKQ